MKKLINEPSRVVDEMVDGIVAVYPGLARLAGHTVVVRADVEDVRGRQVALVSGGGSGHEPAHGGYVGRGMLTAAVAGDVFTSPSPDSVLAAIRAVSGAAGTLLIVKNYTGDRLNFGLAAELARVEGHEVETVVVGDDVALADSTDHAGRRGLAGTVLVHKVAGAAAEAGASLAEVAAEARSVADSVATMGVALTACTVPAAGRPGFELPADEVELGLGIHGEPGVSRVRIERADVLVDRLVGRILAEASLVAGEPVALLVNNLGGTPTMELAIVARRALEVLESRGAAVRRVYMGTFLSALEMAGVSLTVLRDVDDVRLGRLDAPTDAPAWPNAAAQPRGARRSSALTALARPAAEAGERPRTPVGRAVEAGIRAGATAIIRAESRLTDMDRVVGDGDLGSNLARGARALIDALPSMAPDDPSATMHAISLHLQRTLGGTSGALYAVLFLRVASALRHADPDDPYAWADAIDAGARAVAEVGGAEPGDRTMLDALVPAATAFRSALDAGHPAGAALRQAAEAATSGAAATASMSPRRGRSSYLGERAVGYPDPGAEAVAVWLRALARPPV